MCRWNRDGVPNASNVTNLSIADSMFMGRELRKPEGQRRPFGSKVFILNEPTAALGVKGSRKVLELLQI